MWRREEAIKKAFLAALDRRMDAKIVHPIWRDLIRKVAVEAIEEVMEVDKQNLSRVSTS